MRGYVGVTDTNWYRFLSARPDLEEVNFWRPNAHSFRALKVGEPFFFKSHYPHNQVVGGGLYSDFVVLRLSEAWKLFGEANGATSLGHLRELIEPLWPPEVRALADPEIGCVLLRDVRLFAPWELSPPPPQFAPNIVQGKSYDLSEPMVETYFTELMYKLLGLTIDLDLSAPWHRDGPIFGDPRLSRQRLGQRSFQAVVLNAYHRRCAITGTKISPVLQAAHIRPVTSGGEHRLDNGMLLRSDVHTMFDQGYLAVDTEHKLRVSPRLRRDFGNGELYYSKAGDVIGLPDRRIDRPGREFLEWHLDAVFKAS